jgi:hypothetical protein
MYETLLILGGAVAGVCGVALRMREPGESWLRTIARPLGAGGPGPRK